MSEAAILSRKEQIKLKQIAKKEEKKQRAGIIKMHTEKCMAILDKAYDELLIDIDKFNLKLVKMTEDIDTNKSMLETYISKNDIESIKQNIRETSNMASNYFLEVSNYITPGKNKSITEPLTEASKKIHKYLTDLEMVLNLSKNKSAYYITSSVFNILQQRSNEYGAMVCDDFYGYNAYFKALEDTYYEYECLVKEYRRELMKQRNKSEDNFGLCDSQIPKETYGKSRLRVTHADMIDFAKAMGFEENRQTNSTHRIFKNPETGVSVPIPAKKGRPMPQGTMSMLLKQMGYKRLDLAKFLQKK